MPEFLAVCIIIVLLMLAAVVWGVATVSSLTGRLSATQGQLKTLERQHTRRLDVLSGRVGRLESFVAASPSPMPAPRAEVDAVAPLADVPEPEELTQPSEAISAEAEADVADAEELPKPEEVNASLEAFRRAKDTARAEEEAGSPAEAPQEEGEALEVLRPVAMAKTERSETDRGRPTADRNVRPAVRAVAPTARAGLSGLSFEQLLGGKVFVWLGAIALVLTGAFLLKYGYDNYTISPLARVVLAGVFGGAMIGGAFWLRQRSAGIAEALCGAGVAVLFGTVYAGHNLYGLISPGWGYTLLVLITAGAVVLSLRFGRPVALLGLVGGFALPPLLGAQTPGRPAMVVYLLALELGVLAVTRKRGWVGISALTLLGSVVWALGYTLLGGGAMDRGVTALLLMSTAVVFVLNATFAQQRGGERDASKVRQTLWLALGAVGSAAALLSLLVVRNGYTAQDMAMLWVMTAGALVLARLSAKYMPIAWVTCGLSAVVVLGAGVSVWWGGWGLQWPSSWRVLMVGALAFGLLFGLGGYAGQWWPTRRRGFVLMSALAGPVFLVIAVVGRGQLLGLREHWWPWSLGVSLAYALAAWPLVWRGILRPGACEGARRADDTWAASAYGLASVGLAALAIVQGLSHPWLALGWAGLGALSAVVGWRLRLGVLMHASVALAALSAVLLVVPGPFMVEVSGTVVFNRLLIVYGLASLAYGVVAYALHRAGQGEVGRLLQALAFATLALGCVVLVRHGFHPGDFTAQSVRMYEWPTYAVVLMGLGLGAWQAARRFGLTMVGLVASYAGMLGAALSLAGPVLFGNPLAYSGAGGGSLAAGMVYLYVLPAVGVYLLACGFEREGERDVAFALRVGSVVLGSVFVLMQVRNGFNWSDLHRAGVGFYERGTYGLALLGLGWGLFSYARVLGSGFAKRAGRAVAAVGMGASLGIMLAVGNPLLDVSVVGGPGFALALCYAYLLPAVLGWLYARAIDPEAESRVGRLLRLGAVVLVTACVGLQVRNGFHLADLHTLDITRYEWATYGLAWMALGVVFAWARRGLGDPGLLRWAGWCVALLGLGTAMVGTLLFDNPLWTRAGVGTLPILNGLWYLYGPSIVALAVLARRLRTRGLRAEAHAVGGGAIALGFFLLSLLVRQGFSGDGVLLLNALPSGSEWYAYSLAWVVLGVLLLAAGVVTGLDTLRYGSLAVMLIAVGKVFALDTAQLAGLLRVFSFLGLGVTLLLLGYTYQRFVFRRPTPSDETIAEPAPLD
ncbi:MAG: DUF2339 domain-containing protein [Phycisphaerales bacterium JB063]